VLFRQHFLASLAVLLCLYWPLSAGAAVGRTAGVAKVTPTGAASYSIPIVAPPGVNGMTPSLALTYNSRSDSGVAGVGWSIAGLSAIVRCPRTVAQDGEARDVRLDSSDRFCLDDKKLRLVTGVGYGAAGATYRTELETFSRITSGSVAGNGPANFIVRRKDGLYDYYGLTGDSRIEALGQSTPRAWALNKIRDRAGNYIDFTYIEDTTNGSFRISSIVYGGNDVQGTNPTHTISFVYETRPSGEIDSGYIAGSLVKETTRLDRVDVLFGSTLVRRYELSYESPLSSTSKSRLASLQECAGSPIDCFQATTFSYQNGTSGLDLNVNSVGLATDPWILDVDGDGRTDLVYSSSPTSGGGVWMVMLANASGGYNSPINTGVTNTNYFNSIPIDYNADGRDDLLVQYSGGTWWAMLGSSSGFATPVNTGAPVSTAAASDARAMDVNGDGLDDLVWADIVTFGISNEWNGGDKISYRLREWGGTFSSTAVTLVGPTPVNSAISWPPFQLDRRNSRRRTQDFNGDGRADILYRHRSRTWNGTTWVTSTGATVHCVGAWNINAEGVDSVSTASVLFSGDFNADGKSDLLFATTSPLIYTVRLSTGTTLTAGFNVSVPAPSSIVAVLDWDGDGYDDLLIRENASGAAYVLRSTGESFTLQSVAASGFGTNSRVVDANGDGLPDLGYFAGSTWNYRVHAGVMPDLLKTATDGFGNYTTFNYLPLVSSGHTRYADATYPSQDYQGSLPVVTSATASNGIGGSYTVTYEYHGARFNAQGRGFEGFHKRTWQDSRNSIYVDEYYNRGFPYTGTVRAVDTVHANGNDYISQLNNTWTSVTYGSGAEAAQLPYISATSGSRHEVGAYPYNGAQISSFSTTNSIDSVSGTVYDTTLTITEAGSSNGVQPYATYTQRIRQPVANFAAGTYDWCMGRPERIEITNSHNQYGGDQITRTINQTWDVASCRLTQQVVEPDSAQWRVTTDIGYDGFGNVNSRTVTGANMPARSTTANYGGTGRFVQTVTNALSQTTLFSWEASSGNLLAVFDPNAIDMFWQYDAFGRRTRETRADNTFVTWEYVDCATIGCLGSNNKMTILEKQYDTSASLVTQQRIYTDKLDRPISASAVMLSGAYNRIDREYDALGRVYRESAPYWSSGGTPYWTTYTYDLIDRVTQVQRPISDSNPTLQSSLTYYEGLTVRSVDALSKQSTHVRNVLGQLARSTDHDGYYQNFDYDAFSNAVRVMDSSNNVLMSNVYNVRGMRTSQTDMDMGARTYTPNALGEVVSQTDAKSQVTSFGYDLLGRLTTRTEAEGGSTFTFGTSASAHNIGRLASMSGPGYSESFTYDSVGRLSQRTITSDATYQINYAYNAFGALDTLTYPTSTSGYRLKLQYDYQNGALQRVRDFNAPATVFWAANDTDARGSIISETLGNGIQTVRGFDAVTGLLDYIQSGPGGGSSRQNDSYQWDAAGNLTQRSEANIARTQTFAYDNLHRLDSWTTTGATPVDLAYDALGNITSKTGLGTYAYDSTRKHRVLTAGANSYAYDNNGNVTTKNGQPITWYSYNLPKLITSSGSNSSEFFYTPDRSRWKQVASYDGTAENTIYIGGLIEKVTMGTTTSWKHYIAGAIGSVAVYIRRSSGTNETVYLLKDHLGSTEMVTNSSGGQLTRLAYGPLGARVNGGSWSGVPASSAWTAITSTTRRGYTSHEMLDNLSLIHMNGRVYDPDIGRFLSADPFVQAPGFTQSFNRYSYAWNNPLKYTDPSGFICRGINMASNAGAQYCALPGAPPANPPPPSSDPRPAFTPSTVNGAAADTISTAEDSGGGVPRLVIGFRGAGIGWLGLEGDTPSLAAFVEELGGEMYEHGPLARGAAVRAAKEFAEANPDGQIILTGYSRGGRAAFVVADVLGEAGIGVQALILFDPHDLNDKVLRLEHDNVANALNFYQQNPTTSILGDNPFSGRPLAPHMVGSPNHRRFTPRVIRGHNYTGELDVGHLNIVNTSLRRYEELIREALGE
jgi:RHS repeat-associated protein